MRSVMELHCLELYVASQLIVIEVRINSSISLGKVWVESGESKALLAKSHHRATTN